MGQEAEFRQSRKRHIVNDLDPPAKKKRYEDDDADLIAAEILFKKISSDISTEIDFYQEMSAERDPFIRLSPVGFNHDYSFGLLDNEGISDLFDIPVVKT